ncbi:ANTAR domain-containing protein [Rhodopseudomonas palustris]|uniref:ANTAR domain-containing protein n=1 Tax=Rhodopseudomonas palustris TaxID=1076 RepID=A0A323UHI1_RHOPL|nr:ANTAR domain-containing protein [Rhodopseudomonas palustris]PZA11811.1 ANTAR domain-containing protein [Rhodopseudomonas palustris]
MTFRPVQNFKGGRALLVMERTGREGALEPTLAKLGVTCEAAPIVDGRAQLDLASLQPDRDMLFVDGDLDGVLAVELNPLSHLPPVPVIGLVGVEAPSRLKALVNLGATAFLRKPVHGGAVYSALFMGINQFLLRGGMQERLQTLEERRRGRRAVLRAVVQRMRDSGLDEDGAYDQIRRESMRVRQSLESYCEDLLSRRARPPDSTGHTGDPPLHRGDKRAM